jgi:hypothetical protein
MGLQRARGKARRDVAEAVRGVRGIDEIGEQHQVVADPTQRDAFAGKRAQGAFEVVDLLREVGVFEQGAQYFDRQQERFTGLCRDPGADDRFYGRSFCLRDRLLGRFRGSREVQQHGAERGGCFFRGFGFALADLLGRFVKRARIDGECEPACARGFEECLDL